MVLGALLDLGLKEEGLQRAIDSLGLDHCRLEVREVRRRGFRAKHVVVHTPAEKHHRHLRDILGMIDGSALTASQKELATRIFERLAEAEARVHGISREKVHFHEVGAADSIIDIVGAALGWDTLGIAHAYASPVPVGGGTIRISHGEVSVPAPATAELLRGVPIAPSSIQAELTTPTGAAILTSLVSSFGPIPGIVLEEIGCGAGSRDFKEQPNILRILVGEMPEQHARCAEEKDIWVVETNLDDCPGEWIGHCFNRLLDFGVLDVYATSIQMKKNRPGVKLTVLCSQTQIAGVESILLTETTSLGVRRWPAARRTLARSICEVNTPWGPVAGKIAKLPDGSPRFSPEYESCRKIAAEQQLPLWLVYETAQKAFDPNAAGQLLDSENKSPR